MAQELRLLPSINEQSGPITAAEVARKIGSEETLISKLLGMHREPRDFPNIIRSSHHACLDWGWYLR